MSNVHSLDKTISVMMNSLLASSPSQEKTILSLLSSVDSHIHKAGILLMTKVLQKVNFMEKNDLQS